MKMAKARNLRNKLVGIKTSQGCDENSSKAFALEYLTSFLEFLEANNPKITVAIDRRLISLDRVMSIQDRVNIALNKSLNIRE